MWTEDTAWITEEEEATAMSLRVDGSVVPYEGNSSSRSKRETVEDAATATGAAGAGASATKFFRASAEKVNRISATTAETARAVEAPVRQSRSLINGFKINYRNFTKQIANWAEQSNMPNFMKAMFTGEIGKVIGKVAAVFVFITGVGEIFHMLMKNINNVGMKMATMTASPEDYDSFEYMSDREAFARYYANQRRYY